MSSQPKLRIFDDEDILGRHLAERILDGVAEAARRGKRYVLGCPGGRSLRSTYISLADIARRRPDVDLSPLVIAMMDDYVEEESGAFSQVSEDVHFSCRRFAYEEIIGRLEGLPGAPGRDRVLLPDPADPGRYEAQLGAAGGIDLFLLASGASDGHVAFNPPGSEADGSTRIVELAETTRRDNLHTFPEFSGIDEVPTYGVTIGLGSIVRLSRSVVLVCSGAHKQETVRRVMDAGGFDPSWPATIIYRCSDGEVLVDRKAAGSLSLEARRAATEVNADG